MKKVFPLRSPPASSDERGYKKDAEKKQKRLKNWIRYFYLFVMFIAFLCAIHKPIPVMLLSLNASKANHKINKIKTKVSLFREMPRVWLKGGNDFKDLADIFSLQNYLKPPLNYITPQLLHSQQEFTIYCCMKILLFFASSQGCDGGLEGEEEWSNSFSAKAHKTFFNVSQFASV